MKALSLHDPRTDKHQLGLVGRRGNIPPLACLSGLEQEPLGVSQRCAVRDTREAVEKQAPHVTQCFKAPAVFKQERTAQFCVPRHDVHFRILQLMNADGVMA
jgi:hypothetical protein